MYSSIPKGRIEDEVDASGILRAIAVFTDAHYGISLQESTERITHMCQTCVSVYLPKSTLVPWDVLIICLSITRGRTLHMQQYLDLLIDALLDEGFTVEEANRLIQLREEYEEQLATEETNYHRFIRWLVDHGRLSDWY